MFLKTHSLFVILVNEVHPGSTNRFWTSQNDDNMFYGFTWTVGISVTTGPLPEVGVGIGVTVGPD